MRNAAIAIVLDAVLTISLLEILKFAFENCTKKTLSIVDLGP